MWNRTTQIIALCTTALVGLVILHVEVQGFSLLPKKRQRIHDPSCHFDAARRVEMGATVAKNDNESLNDNTKAEEASLESCPFSKSYPRYRIDLTRKRKDTKEKKMQLPSFLTNMSNSWLKSNFEKDYKHHGTTQWMETARSNVETFASLWKCAAALQQESSSNSMVLAFPHLQDTLVLQRWIDIVDWFANDETNGLDGVFIVQATILQENPIPIIQLESVRDKIQSPLPEVDDNHVLEKRMKAWVKRILVDLSICPFTKSVTKSGHGLSDLGVPVGRIAYHSSNATPRHIHNLMADTWEAISNMLEAGPSGKEGISSILLAAPHFDDDFEVWSGPIFAMLEAGVVAASAEQQVGVVCFHPRYATPDGSSFPGFGHMHSVPRLRQWVEEFLDETLIMPDDKVDMDQLVAQGGAWQRRTPHATINVLRADQLEIAESRRSSGKMYTENIHKLVGVPHGVGTEKLAQDLQNERQMKT